VIITNVLQGAPPLSQVIMANVLQVFNEHPSRIISLEMIARLVSEAEDSLKLQHQVPTVYFIKIANVNLPIRIIQ
jgi:hypothetical protein